MKKKLTRREFLRAAGLTAASVTALSALEACAPQATPAPEGKAPPAKAAKVVEFLAWGGPTDIKAVQKVTAGFLEKYPDYVVKVTIGPWGAVSGSPFYTKLQTMVAGGVPPDISWFQGWMWQPYADKGVLAPLDDFIKRDNFTDPFPDVTGSHQTTERDGKTWMVPMEQPTMVMLYAKKHFDEAGIPYPTDDWTLEEFLDIAVKLTDTSGDFKKYGYQANGVWFRDIHWIRSTGKQEFDTLIDPHKAQFNQPEIVDMVQLVASDVYYKYKCSPSPADITGGANTIQTGNCAMKYEGPWFFPELNSPTLREEGKQVEFDVVVMPKCADPARPHRALTSGLCILNTERSLEDAWTVASYFTGEEGDKIFCQESGRIPNSFKLAESWWIPMINERFGVTNGKAFIEAFQGSEVDVIGGIDRARFDGEVVKPVAWDPLTLGSATAAEVLPEADKQLQVILDEYWAEQGG